MSTKTLGRLFNAYIFLCLFFSIGFFTFGCVNGFKVTPTMGATAETLAVAGGGTAILRNNPKYIPVIQALAAGIDVAVAASPTITLDGINQYIVTICTQRGVPASDLPLFIALADPIFNAYVAQYKSTVISSTDPTALIYIAGFKDGLNAAALTALAFPKK